MYTIHHGQSSAYLSERVNTAAAQTLRLGLRSANTMNELFVTSTIYKVRRACFLTRRTGSMELSTT